MTLPVTCGSVRRCPRGHSSNRPTGTSCSPDPTPIRHVDRDALSVTPRRWLSEVLVAARRLERHLRSLRPDSLGQLSGAVNVAGGAGKGWKVFGTVMIGVLVAGAIGAHICSAVGTTLRARPHQTQPPSQRGQRSLRRHRPPRQRRARNQFHHTLTPQLIPRMTGS